jgi:methanogenic corrinoid protein MtbC1
MKPRPPESGGAPQEPEYSIRVVSRLTGLSTDTLRMWERRYGYPKPTRADSGVRVYARSDIERLTLIARGIKLGYRVGESVCLDVISLKRRLAHSDPAKLNLSESRLPHDLVDCIIADDPDSLRVRLRRAAVMLGTKRFISEVAAPLLVELGEAWEGGAIEVQQEHLATEILQSQLHVMFAAYEGSAGPTIVLATLPREYHALGLQLVGLYLAACGAVPRILGADTPTAQIAKAAKALNAAAVGLSISLAASSVAASNHLEALMRVLDSSIRLWLGGRGASRIGSRPERAMLLDSWDQLEDAFESLHQQ